jgi:hypothetical protein
MGSKMKITKRQLRRIIREAIDDETTTPDAWANQNGLQLELDNEGQKIIYLDNEQADRLNLPIGVNWSVEQQADGWIIYTGEY